jgi:formiminoglutamase
MLGLSKPHARINPFYKVDKSMTSSTRYLPPDPNQWQGRTDTPPGSCFFQLIQMLNLLEHPPTKTAPHTFALLGFRCDEGIHRNYGRVGSAEGPNAIRQALAKLPIQISGIGCVDAGNITCADGDLESTQAALGEVVTLLLQHGLIPIILGGGHELAWGHYQGIAKSFPDKHVGIINFDAHFDMRPLPADGKGHAGSTFLQIANQHKATKSRLDYNCVGIQHAGNIRQLLETAKANNTNVIWADELHQGQHDKTVDFIDRIIDQNEVIYLSLSLDVFAAAYAPGVSDIQPLGLSPWHVIPLLRQIAGSGKVISCDVVELSPRHDIDQRTAKLAASLIYEFIHHYNEQPRPW